MIKEIYLVEGCTGEYSDRSEWPVCAFTTKALAESLAKQLSDLARDAARILPNNDSTDMYNYEWDKTESGKELLILDPNVSIDYTGTDYTVYAVELREGE